MPPPAEQPGSEPAAEKPAATPPSSTPTFGLAGRSADRAAASRNRLRSVEVTRPPRMTTASGYSISWPGLLPAMTSGTRARPVVRAVIRIGASRSSAPRRTRARPNGSPSSSSRWRKWLTSMMPLRAAMPSTVTKPTSEPSDSTPPVSSTATTPPIRAKGIVSATSSVGRQA